MDNAPSNEQLVEVALEVMAPPLPKFVLILQDQADGQGIDIAGLAEPAEHNENSPAHIVGAFIRDNLQGIVTAARIRSRPAIRTPDGAIVMPQREIDTEATRL